MAILAAAQFILHNPKEIKPAQESVHDDGAHLESSQAQLVQKVLHAVRQVRHRVMTDHPR